MDGKLMANNGEQSNLRKKQALDPIKVLARSKLNQPFLSFLVVGDKVFKACCPPWGCDRHAYSVIGRDSVQVTNDDPVISLIIDQPQTVPYLILPRSILYSLSPGLPFS